MNIDWFTVVAQAINFLVLLWLMKRFLYKPILHAIDEREKRIAEELGNAKLEKATAIHKQEEYDRKIEDLGGRASGLLERARDEGQAEKARLLKEANDSADALAAKRRESFDVEERTARDDIRRRMQDEVLAITRRVLADLGGASLEERVIGVFNRRLRDLGEEEKDALTSALRTPTGTVSVLTALDIIPELRAPTEASIREIVGSKAKVLFESAPELIGGIELRVDGFKLAWSVADYLSAMKDGFAEYSEIGADGERPGHEEIIR